MGEGGVKGLQGHASLLAAHVRSSAVDRVLGSMEG